MVDKLTRFGVISSDHVENAFRRVDRKFFVPRGNESMAHSDQPLKEGRVHISAPHMYGAAIQALDLVPNSSISFLNVGSGTGYISCIAAKILGPNSLHYGVELHDDVIEHCKASIARWKPNTVEERDENCVFHFLDDTPDIQIIKGNGLNISNAKGEGGVGFDRIYVGAAVSKADLSNITKLLSPGGILVGPVDDDFVKVVRVGAIYREMESGDEDSSVTELNEYSSQILSGVRFAPLQVRPVMTTVIPSNVWSPSMQRGYPSEFKLATRQLLLCLNSQLVQPLPVPRQEERFNVAAMLPKTIWLEILSYTHRKWFEPEPNENDYLKRRLREEKAKLAKAETARREAEARCLAAERERAVYRLLALRWQSRLNSLLTRQGHQGINVQQNDVLGDLSDIFDLVGARDNNNSTLSVLRAMLQQLNDNATNEDEDNDSDENSSNAGNEDGGEDMEEDDAMENQGHSGEDEDNSDLDDFASVADEEPYENDSVVMEEVGRSIETGQRAFDQPRSVSLSSDDL